MIVEFVGLPGAGKSSLEAALLQQLKLAGVDTHGRRRLVEQLISGCSPLPRDRIGFFRRISTALYKSSLLTDCLLGKTVSMRAADLGSRHRFRALLRVSEDMRLYRSEQVALASKRCVNLSEGLCQHLAALEVWRMLLGGGFERTLPLPESKLAGCRALVVYVDVPEAVALERLLARGCPPSWPHSCSPERVVSLFNSNISRVLDGLGSCPGISVIRVDGTLASMDWIPESRRITGLLKEALSIKNSLELGSCA